jgi:hypothetical protein
MSRFTSGVIVAVAGAALSVGAAVAQTAAPNPSCAKSIDITAGGTGNAANGSFVCIGALDGNGLQQIVVGLVSSTGGPGFMFIVENTGTIRKKICWNGSCPTFVVQ